MPMTVRELLDEPHLGLRLIAGEAGVEQPITWSHTSDLPNLWEWVSEGVLLLTNGLSIPESAEGQVTLAERLVSSGAVGLAVGDEMHAPKFTEAFLNACSELPLPLLAVPYPLPFIAISRSIAEALLIEESRRIKQTARLYDILRRSSTPGNAWDILLHDLSTELGSYLFVIDDYCLHPWNHTDPIPDATTQIGILRARQEAGTTSRHFHWTKHDGRSILLMDIPTHANALLAVAPHSEHPHPDGVVLLHAATIIGLAMSQQALYITENQRTAETLFSQVVLGGSSETIGSRYGLVSDDIRVVCYQPPAEGAPGDYAQRLRRHGVPTIATVLHGTAYLLVAADSSLATIRHILGPEAVGGISSSMDKFQISRAVLEARWACGKAKQESAGLLQYSEDESWLGFASLQEGEQLVSRMLAPLLEYDQRTGSDLTGTLRLYLRLQRSAQRVATTTFTHRQTVISRLKKIGNLIDSDLSETHVLAVLWLALQFHDALSPAQGNAPGQFSE
ncbi:PucR family transcriptional regulator [Glutamicibacter creatinolyticus]|uniref:PucR family transcriptional regulator n=2 Tax=Glutamicibacter creatinolyticus TaxID=162496 RepID=A0A5B7WWQ3_9MICC|nr:PucR family transcriptional regulator [Glutamicibacter creatinolyticus]